MGWKDKERGRTNPDYEYTTIPGMAIDWARNQRAPAGSPAKEPKMGGTYDHPLALTRPPNLTDFRDGIIKRPPGYGGTTDPANMSPYRFDSKDTAKQGPTYFASGRYGTQAAQPSRLNDILGMIPQWQEDSMPYASPAAGWAPPTKELPRSAFPWDQPGYEGKKLLTDMIDRYKSLQGMMGKTMLRGKKQALVAEMGMIGQLIPSLIEEAGGYKRRDLDIDEGKLGVLRGELGLRGRETFEKEKQGRYDRAMGIPKALADILQSVGLSDYYGSAVQKNTYEMGDAYHKKQMEIIHGRNANQQTKLPQGVEKKYSSILKILEKAGEPGYRKGSDYWEAMAEKERIEKQYGISSGPADDYGEDIERWNR